MFPDEGRVQGPVGPVDIQKLNPDPTAFEMAADYGPTADPAESGQLEPQALSAEEEKRALVGNLTMPRVGFATRCFLRVPG